jgi:hypothetical protein
VRLDVLHFVTFCCICSWVGLKATAYDRDWCEPSDFLALPLGLKVARRSGNSRARWWVRWCSRSGRALKSLGVAAGTKGRSALRELPGSLVGSVV